MGAFSSCLTLNGLHLFAALDSTMPVEFPEDEDEGESEDEDGKDAKPSTELLNEYAHAAVQGGEQIRVCRQVS